MWFNRLFICFHFFVAILTIANGQTWDYRAITYQTIDIPIWMILQETTANGYYDLGDGRSVKAVIYELGGCSQGHPCAASTGYPKLYPEGCPTNLCVARWTGDPWQSYDYKCQDELDPNQRPIQEILFQNVTSLSTEWFDYFDTTCLLRYVSATDSWEHENNGVVVVIKSQGFNFPPQTIFVSDIDSLDDSAAGNWPDVMQEAVTNFGVIGNTLIKPNNTYGADHYSAADLLFTQPILTEVNITLKQDFLNALGFSSISEDWVMGSISALSQSQVNNFAEFAMPDEHLLVAGGTVWVDMDTEFDSKLSLHLPTIRSNELVSILFLILTFFFLISNIAWVTSMTLGRKYTGDPDQQVQLYPLQAYERCKCLGTAVSSTTVIRPTETDFICTVHVVPTTRYSCDDSGSFYCTISTRTAWDRSGADNNDGTVPCSPRNTTVIQYDIDIASVVPADWSNWPTVDPPVFAYPSATPFASASPNP